MSSNNTMSNQSKRFVMDYDNIPGVGPLMLFYVNDDESRKLATPEDVARESEWLRLERDAFKELSEAYEMCDREGIDLDAETNKATNKLITNLANRLHELKDVLRQCREEWDTIDNGTCAVCRIGHRLYDLKGNRGICEWPECLSHKIRSALDDKGESK